MATIASYARGRLLLPLACLFLLLLPAIGRAQSRSRAPVLPARPRDGAASIAALADLTWSPRNLESISLICGADTAITVYLQNTTPFPIDVVSAIVLSGSAFAVQAGVPIHIPGNGQSPIGLKFFPPAQGLYRDTIQLYIPGGSPDIVKIPVQGRRETIAFTAAVVANLVAMAQQKSALWVGLLALVPLILLLASGLYLFVLPYLRRGRRA